MKRIVNALSVAMLVLLFVLAGPAAKAEWSPQFDGLEFREADGFYTVIVDLSGAEYRFDGILDISTLEQNAEIFSIASYHIYYGDNAVMDVVLREIEAAAVDPDITSADGVVLTGGYYAVTFDIDEEYEAFLTGLTLDNLQEVQLELINAVITGTSFNMTHLDFIDTEKIEWGEGENKDLCWAAACANVLHYTGWAQKVGLSTPDDVFEVYIDAFSPSGGNAIYGIPWFFGGINAKQGAENWAQVDNTETYAYGEFDGFLPEYAVDNFLTGYYMRTAPQDIELTFADLRGGSGVNIAFGWYSSGWTRNGGHAITLWGYIQKKSASGFDKNDYYALIVSDSDSDDVYDERRNAPNKLWMLTLTPVVTTQGYDSWMMQGYSTSLYALLENFYALEPYSDEHPMEESASANKFDGVATDIIPYIKAVCGDTESSVFTSGDSITLRFGAENATQFSWSESRTVTISYSLTNASGVTIDKNTLNGALTLSSGGAQFFKKTVNLPAGEYTLTVTVSMADSSYAETYYSNNTASYTFIVVDVPEITLSAAVSGEDDELTASIAVDDASALVSYDLFELSVSYLNDDVWSDWTTVAVGRTIPTSCDVAALGTQVKFRLEAEAGGVLSSSWESEPVSLERVSTHTLEDNGDLRALLANDAVQDGDTIQLLGTANVNDTNSDSAPWVIDKAVTITGGTIDLRAGGILLGADVTFDGVTLAFGNRVRNAILANGHTLTLKNVQQSSSANAVHLFCGGLTGHSVTAPTGTHGKIIIMGSTALGNIYAGSMSSDGSSNTFALPASIIVDSAATGKMGTLYACGALEAYVDPDEMLNPDYVVAAPTANAELFAATGAVSIELYQSVIKTVDGMTGGANAIVTFNGSGDLCALTLTNLGGLAVQSGHLVPEDSSLVSSADVSIAQDARLDMTGFGNALTIADFSGGGELVLGESQTVTITGTVSGATSVGIGGIFNDASEGTIDNEHVYIIAANSTDESFVLLPSQSDTTAVFKRDEEGNWTVPTTEVAVVIESASVPENLTVESGEYSLEIPVTISYVSDLTYSYLGVVPVEITVNGVAAELHEDEYGYYYTFPESAGLGETAFYYLDETTENLSIYAADDVGVIPDGKYTIIITIPGNYTQSKETVTLTTVVTVGESEPEPDPNVIASGTCGENLTWVLTKDGTFTVSGEGEMDQYWVLVNGAYTTPWAEYADDILRAEIGSGVTTICNGLFFNCTNLTDVTIADGVTYIGNKAFYGCESLKSITIPESVEEMWSEAFKGCTGLTSIVIPDKVTILESAVFAGCESLESITLPAGIFCISENAFSGCTALKIVNYGGYSSEWELITIGDGNEALTNAEISFPDAPALTLTVNASGSITLTWTEDGHAEYYEVWRIAGDGSFERLAVIEGTTYTDTTAVPGTEYFYMVRGVSGTASGDCSDIVVYFKMRRGPLGVKPE